MKIRRVRITWLILALLLAFVLFVKCIVEVGGDAEPLARPEPTVSPVSTPTASSPAS